MNPLDNNQKTNGNMMPMPPISMSSHVPQAFYQVPQQLMSMPNMQQQQQQQQQQHSPQQALQISPLSSEQQPQQQHMPQILNNSAAFPMPPTAYINNLIASTAGTSNSTTNMNQFDVVNMTYDNFKSEKTFLSDEPYKMLAEDFTKVTKMNLLDDEDPDLLYTLFVRNSAFNNNTYYFGALANLYRNRYSDLYEKYPSLSVYVEFCLATIIFKSEEMLRSNCISNVVKLPNSGNTSGFNKLIRTSKKRSAAPIDVEHGAPKVKISNVTKHPFFDTSSYKSKQTLFSIGKCTDYCIPADFASLSFVSTQGTVNKMDAKVSHPFDGLKLTFLKPVLCILTDRICKTYKFSYLEHLSQLANLLTKMTGKGISNSQFGFGKKQKLNVLRISSGQFEDVEKVSKGYIMTLVNNLSIFQLGNNTLLCKTYSDLLFNLDDKVEITQADMIMCENLIEDQLAKSEEIIRQYEIANGIIPANDESEEIKPNDTTNKNDDDIVNVTSNDESTNIEMQKTETVNVAAVNE